MKTRQISSYLNWADKRGCLFFVEQDFETGRKGGIFLIDSSCRISDKPSEFDSLHRAELNALSNENVILAGALGDLFAYCATTKKYLWNDWVNRYWIPKPATLGAKQQIRILVEECRNWLDADKQILNAFPYKEVMAFIEDVFRKYAIAYLKSIMSQTEDLIWKVQAKLPFEQKVGFSSYFLNYIAIKNTCENAIDNAKNCDVLAQLIVDGLSEDGPGYPIDKIDFKITKAEFGLVCKCYLDVVLESIPKESYLNVVALTGTSLDYLREDWKQMIDREFNKYDYEKNHIFVCVHPQIAQNLNLFSYGLFQYFLRHYDLAEEDQAAYQLKVNDLFPDYSKKSISVHPHDQQMNPINQEQVLVTYKHTEKQCIEMVRRIIINYKKKSVKCKELFKLDGEYINLNALSNDEQRAEFFNQFIPEGEKKITASDISKARNH